MIFPTSVPGLLKLLIDEQRPLIKVHAVPLKAQDLPLSHPSEERDGKQCFKPVPPDRLEKGAALQLIKRVYFFLLHPGESTGLRRVEADVTHGYGLLEGLVEHAVDVLHGLCTETTFSIGSCSQLIIELLDSMRAQGFQSDCS